jgi:hypothetical protein
MVVMEDTAATEAMLVCLPSPHTADLEDMAAMEGLNHTASVAMEAVLVWVQPSELPE